MDALSFRVSYLFPHTIKFELSYGCSFGLKGSLTRTGQSVEWKMLSEDNDDGERE
jgi:hypothetical protein